MALIRGNDRFNIEEIDDFYETDSGYFSDDSD